MLGVFTDVNFLEFCMNREKFGKVSIDKTFQFWQLTKTNSREIVCKKARVFKEKTKFY